MAVFCYIRQRAEGMGMSNPDIDTPPAFIQAYDEFPYLLSNPAIAAEFKACEARANKAKARYTLLGQYGLIAAFLSFSSVIYIVTIEEWLSIGPKVTAPSEEWWFRVIFFALGVSGVAAQIYLLIGPHKRRWLNARVHAERLRSLKFQAFKAVACGGDQAVAGFTVRALGELAIEACDLRAARHNFKPEAALVELEGEPCLDGANLDKLRDCYQKLRIDRQTAFAISEIKRIEHEKKLPASWSEVLFWTGAALAYIDAILAFVEVTWPPLRPILHCLTLELFIASALLFVLQLGRSYDQAIERYEDYREHMLEVGEQLAQANTAAEFVAGVDAAERQALRELRLFCREGRRSTYLI
jgi:hypothetical protein